MNQSLYSSYWYRVDKLRPKLNDSTQLSRQIHRGQPWYLLRNEISNRNHLFNQAAYQLISRMDGVHTVGNIWQEISRQNPDQLPTQDEVIQLLARLHDADLVKSDILPNTFDSVGQQRTPQQRQSKALNPFFLKLPLWNPDDFLDRWNRLVAPLFSNITLLIWSLLVVNALVQAALNWAELSSGLAQLLQSPQQLLLLWLTYPLVKICHELGHAFAVKKWGGEVREMGIVLLALTPIPYVEASASGAFSDKRQRIAVSAMGMAVELILAALAVPIWLNIEAGLVRDLLGNLILIGGISTVLFNGNPLLRYDGYYILSDLIEIPNLRQRSNRYLDYLTRRFLLGDKALNPPQTARGEKAWLIGYGPLAAGYRLLVMIGLIAWISKLFLGLGVLLAIWGGISLVLLPAARVFRNLWRAAALQQQRRRTLWLTAGSFSLLLLFCLVPVPHWTSAQGIVWMPEEAEIRSGADCELTGVMAEPGQNVARGIPLLRCENPYLRAEKAILQARIQELSAEYSSYDFREQVKRNILLEEIEQLKAEEQELRTQLDKLLIQSPRDGKFSLIDNHNLTGRFVSKGELLGYIVNRQAPRVRAVVPQDDIALVRERTQNVEVLLAEQLSSPLPATIQRIVPAADFTLPSAVLGSAAGGAIPVDPTDPDGLRVVKPIFQLELNLPNQLDPHIGGRAYIKFSHGYMPLALQWYRDLRQLLLRHLDG